MISLYRKREKRWGFDCWAIEEESGLLCDDEEREGSKVWKEGGGVGGVCDNRRDSTMEVERWWRRMQGVVCT